MRTKPKVILGTAAGAAARFSHGFVTSPEPEINQVMFNVAEDLVRNDEDLTDDICASAALGLAAVEVPPRKVDKGGFARGIKRKKMLTVHVPGLGDVTFHNRLFNLGTAVGVLFPGGG